MSAITPHIEQQDDPSVTPAEREWFQKPVAQRVQGADDVGELNPTLAEQHRAEQHSARPRAPAAPAPQPTPRKNAQDAAIRWLEENESWPPDEILAQLSEDDFIAFSEYASSAHPELYAEEEDYEEEDYAQVAGLGQVKPESQPAFARKAQQASHAGLIRTGWTRRAIEEALVGRTISVILVGDLSKSKRPKGASLNDGILQLDEPIFDPVFNSPGTGIRNIPLLSWTSKMGCPSFSLPAGPAAYGGACPAADGGQTIVPRRKLKRAQLPVIGVQGPVDTMETVCQWCYATGGNYRFGSNQLNQVVRLVWARQAVRDGSFREVMSWAVQHADYRLAGNSGMPAERFRYTDAAGDDQVIRFFRIHDSGDFFNKEYLSAWTAVARNNPSVQFWAPTRIWAKPELGALVKRYNPPSNLSLRPSSYMIDRPADAGLWSFSEHGYTGPTTVYDKKNKPPGAFQPDGDPYHWDCQAYATLGENHTCRNALSPPPDAGGDGEIGCRACWLHPGISVNYTKH